MDKKLFNNYTDFLSRLDELCSGLYEKLQDSMQCRRGCTMCCIAGISVLPVEAYYIAAHLPDGFTPRGSEPTGEISEKCIFLQDGLCAIYSLRLVLCRTQGFPLLYGSEPQVENEENYELSYCELNFKDTGNFEEHQLIDMDRINLSLAAINIRFLHESGMAEELSHKRIKLIDIISLHV